MQVSHKNAVELVPAVQDQTVEPAKTAEINPSMVDLGDLSRVVKNGNVLTL